MFTVERLLLRVVAVALRDDIPQSRAAAVMCFRDIQRMPGKQTNRGITPLCARRISLSWVLICLSIWARQITRPGIEVFGFRIIRLPYGITQLGFACATERALRRAFGRGLTKRGLIQRPQQKIRSCTEQNEQEHERDQAPLWTSPC